MSENGFRRKTRPDLHVLLAAWCLRNSLAITRIALGAMSLESRARRRATTRGGAQTGQYQTDALYFTSE